MVLSTLLLPQIICFKWSLTNAGVFSEISDEEYLRETSELINLATEITTLASDSDGKDERVALLRTSINKWVAKYRRVSKFAGRPSFGNMYTALNSISGHFNNFGSKTFLPKKRLDRVLQELGQSSLFLSRGR